MRVKFAFLDYQCWAHSSGFQRASEKRKITAMSFCGNVKTIQSFWLGRFGWDSLSLSDQTPSDQTLSDLEPKRCNSEIATVLIFCCWSWLSTNQTCLISLIFAFFHGVQLCLPWPSRFFFQLKKMHAGVLSGQIHLIQPADKRLDYEYSNQILQTNRKFQIF